MHGAGGPELDGDGDGAGLDRLRGDVSVDARRAGRFANPAERQTLWTAPQQEGTVPVTVTVTCPTDNKTATDTVKIQVTRRPAPKAYTFEDVYFDFDRYSLRPEATRVLDDAVTALQRGSDAARDHRRAHLQHRHGRIQPGARRSARERGARLPRQPRRRRRTGCRRSATARSGPSTTTRAKKRAG